MSGSSGMIDEDTARAVNTGRETIGVMLRTAQQRLQVVFIAFVVGLFAGIVAMRSYVWNRLKSDLLAHDVPIIFQTPFDVILLQVKIGLGVGIVFAIPVLLYYAREPLERRGILPDIRVSRWKIAGVGLAAAVLFVAGIYYAYVFFFPMLFDFLVKNARNAALAPKYGIVHWTQFVFILSLAFGVAAQMPLIMGSLTFGGIVTYRTWVAYWKHAVLAIIVLASVINGSPDPFSMALVAGPMIALYGIGLIVARFVGALRGELTHAKTERVPLSTALVDKWNLLLAGALVGGVAGYSVAKYDVPYLPPVETLLGVGQQTAATYLGVAGGVLFFLVGVVLVALFAREEAVTDDFYGGKAPKPENLNLEMLDADGVRAAPDERFDAMDEQEALSLAHDAMEEGHDEKAQAILDRFDEAQERAEEAEAAGGAAAAGEAAEGEGESEEAAGGGSIGDVVTNRTAGAVDAFTEGETTEEDIGGYFYDIVDVVSALRSRAVVLVGTFMAVMTVVFAFLYRGGLGMLKQDFLSKLPPQVVEGGIPFEVITLHPVEALVFEVKISAIAGAIAILPMVLFYAWPTLEEKGVVTADRSVTFLWGGSLFAGLIIGSALGYLYVAPTIISYLVYDAIQANMIISYRISNFLWLVFLTTAGIGLFADIPITMCLFHYAGIVDYRTMRERWRVTVLGAFAVGALVTPESMYTMLIVAIPMATFYLIGLGVLWVATLGGRRGGGGSRRERPA
ncbi:twin-arginine translocase subunit TatC [Halospeciosus flavus]|uniref:Sec-independent protein translocase protein TatC n=1 Tax=Halospeciosus flavus TaxID=3032283 RepID=A0ABD5Z7W6_9EURY|nr:twin-arginine translocase subunit TatC [Halospeciosus flavus]